MKKLLLPLPLVLLTFGMFANNVIADEWVILGSVERLTEEYDAPLFESSINRESTLNGFSAKLYGFRDSRYYHGLSYVAMTGDVDFCLQSNCPSVDTTVTMVSVEFGRALGQCIPYVSLTWTQTEAEETETRLSDSENRFIVSPGYVIESTADTSNFNIGYWLELDTIKVRGSLNNLDGKKPMGVSGGVLLQMDNKFAVGAEIEIQLDSEAEGFRFSLQFGRSF